MGTHTIVVGAQWGDEGKGKVSDLLAGEHDVACRFSGGDNAAHTVVVGGERHVFRILPAAVLQSRVALLAAHVVFDPTLLCNEIHRYRERFGKLDLTIDHRAHLVLPYHRSIDATFEDWRGESALRSTRRGIGPCCADRTDRIGIRVGELLDLEELRRNLERIVPFKRRLLGGSWSTSEPPAPESVYEFLASCADSLVPYLGDGTRFFEAHRQARSFLFEGAQGAMLDNTYGHYPFVAGYSTLASALFPSLGVAPFAVRSVGVASVYTTQIGSAPFPTEQCNDLGRELQRRGHERSFDGYWRRCGWLDLNILRYGIAANGCSELALTKLDVLDTFDPIQVCVGYQLEGDRIDYPPTSFASFSACVPLYRQFSGWRSDTRSVKQYSQLPAAAHRLIEFVEANVAVPVRILSTGPGREHTLVRW